MISIYQSNPQAFDGNINLLKAGATLQIPDSGQIEAIYAAAAASEVSRQYRLWQQGGTDDGGVAADTGRLKLVTPEQGTTSASTVTAPDAAVAQAGATALESRVQQLEAELTEARRLLEVRNAELATLQGSAVAGPELETAPAEVAEPTESAVVPDDAQPVAGDLVAEGPEAAAEAAVPAVAEEAPQAPVAAAAEPEQPGLIARLMEYWWLLAGLVAALLGALLFLRHRRESSEAAVSLEEAMARRESGELRGTSTVRRTRDTDILVEEKAGIEPGASAAVASPPEASARPVSIEDTLSGEAQLNLEAGDPLAEADFHMAYGLYDQAADLINGALESDPNDKALMSKLCEIYFVWGNRDAFVDAASSLKRAVGDADTAEWDKIVIMGQQIAAEDALFAGAGVAGATKAVDLSFDDDSDDAGALDMDFGAAGDEGGEVIDLGGDGEDIFDFSASDDTAEQVIDLGGAEESDDDADDGMDFAFEEEPATETSKADSSGVDFDFGAEEPGEDSTAEMPGSEEPRETPTIEEQFSGFDATSELPSIPEAEDSIAERPSGSDETAEINLDELDLDLDGLAETELASLDDLDATGTNEVLVEDLAEITGKNPEIDPDATGLQEAFDADTTGIREALDLDDIDDDLGSTGLRLAPDETGRMPMLDAADEFDLLDATGHTQILSEDLAVETGTDVADLRDDDATMLAPNMGDDETTHIGSDAETLLAPMDDDDDDFDFAKTEALPADVFTGNQNLDETSEMPSVARTDFDLDLDDLTAALQVSEVGDTVEQPRDDATVEYPRPSMDDETAEVPTMSLGPDDMSDDLHEARTMTEVGTKLDLARAYVDMGDPQGARSILEEVLDEGDASQRQQAQQLLDSLPG